MFVFTHDGIGVGEDGPTHQPIEQIASLRAIPDFAVIRPAEHNETAAAWKTAIQRNGPVALVLTRQKLPVLDAPKYPVAEGAPKGAYVLSDCDGAPDVILIGSGSEVHLAMESQQVLAGEGVKARVVSMPSWELFKEQTQQYRDSVLPPDVKARLAIETGCTLGWRQWVGDGGDVIGIDRFGASAPYKDTFKAFGFTVENVVAKVKGLLNK